MRVVFAVLCLAVFAAAQSCGSAAGCSLQACGNGRCDYPKEDCNTCPLDCGLCPSCDNVCGNRLCEENEDACSCREDCGVCCQNGVCEVDAGESFANCPVDCSVSLVGSVVDAATRAPIVGADITVVCRNGDDELPPPPITDNSAFEYLTREAGTYTCTAMADRYLPNSQTITLRANVQPSDPARPRPIMIPLQRIHTGVYGTVSSATGARIAHARVVCSADGHAMREFTNVRGGFHFGQMVVADGAADWTCTATAAGYDDSADQTVVLSQTESTKVEFTLVASPTDLEVRVVDGTTEVAVSTPTSVWCQAKTFGNADLPAVDVNPATGTVTYTAIAPGAYQCHASSDSYHGSCDLVHAHMGELARVDIVVKARPGHIRGVTCENDCVIDPADGSCVNATLAARIEVTCTMDDSASPHQGRTQFNIGSYSSEREDEVGQFTIGNLPAGEYICVGRFPWRYEDSAPVRAVVRPCEYTDIKIVMPPRLGEIVGLVYVPEQGGAIVPLDGASIVCTDGQLVQRPTTSFPIFYDPSLISLTVGVITGYQPNYVIDDANAGAISCTCSADGFDDTTTTGTLIEGGRVRIDCPMRPFLGTVRSRLIDAQTEQDVCRGSVQCDGVSRQYSEREPPAGQGPNPFVFSGEFELRIGSYECVGSSIPEYFNSPIGAVEVTGSGEFPVDLIAQPQPAEIVGRVFDSGIDDPDGVFFNSGIENAQVTCDVTKTMGHDSEPRASVQHISGLTPPAGNYGIGGVLQFAVWPLSPAECVPAVDTGGQATCVARATGFDANQQSDVTHRARSTIVDFALQAFIAPITVRHVDELTGLFVTTAGDTFCRRSGDSWRRTERCNGPCDTSSYVFPDKRSDTYSCACSADGYADAPVITFDHAAPTETVVDCQLGPLGHDINIGVFDLRDRVPTPPFPGANTPLAGTVVCSFDDGTPDATPPVDGNGIASLSLFNFGATMTCTSAFPNFEGEPDGMTGDLSNVVTIQIQRDSSDDLPTFLGPIASNLGGVVTDSLNGGLLANVTVSLRLSDGVTVVSTVTNANGAYNFAIRDNFGMHRITTLVHTAPPQYEVNSLTVDEDVDIQPENNLVRNYQLTPIGSGIDIVVEDSSVAGIPRLENATITCSSADFNTVVVRTNSQGQASIDYTIVAWPFNGGSDFSCLAEYLELGPNVYTTETLAVNLVRNAREPLLFQIGRLSVNAEIRVSFSVTSGGPSDGRPDVGPGVTFRAFLMPEDGLPAACFGGGVCATTNPYGSELIDSIPAPQGRGPLQTGADSILRFSVPVQGNVGLLLVDRQNFTGIDSLSWSEDGICPGNCYPYNGFPAEFGGDGISYDLDTVDEINRLMTLPGDECFQAGADSTPDAACAFNPAFIPKNLRVRGCIEQDPLNRVQNDTELVAASVELRDANDVVLGSGQTNEQRCYDFTTGATFTNATLIIRANANVATQYTSQSLDVQLLGFGILEQIYDQPTVQLRQNNEFTLSGFVEDPFLDPIDGATVQAYVAGGAFTPPTTGDVIADNGGEPSTVTNASGFWQLDNVWSNSANGGTYVCAHASGFRSSAADGAPAQLCQEFPSLASDLVFDFRLIKEGSIIQVELVRYSSTGQRIFLINRQARVFPSSATEAEKGDKKPLNTINNVLYTGLLNNAFSIECFYQSDSERRVNATACLGYDIGGSNQRAGNGILGDLDVLTECQHDVSGVATQVDMGTDSCIACGCTTQTVFNLGGTDRVFAQCVFCDDQTDANLEGDCSFPIVPEFHGTCTNVRDCPGSCHGCLGDGVARADGIPTSCAGFV